MWVKKQHLEPDVEQLTGSKLGKKYDKAVYCHPAYLTYMQCIPWEILGWMNHKLESRLPGDISITSDTSEEELKSLLIKVKEESDKAGLKLNIQKTKIMASNFQQRSSSSEREKKKGTIPFMIQSLKL